MTKEFIVVFLMAILLLMFKISMIFKFYVKYLFFALVIFFFATVPIPLMFLNPFDYRNGLIPAWGARQGSKILGLKWDMQGHKNIVQDKATILLINHQSVLDLLVLAEIWPIFHRCTVIAKRALFYFWPCGLAAWLLGTVFIDRSNKKGAQEAINLVANTINSKKAKICMFPEGTRHGGQQLLPFKKGAFHIAIKSQAPIQPVVVARFNFLNHKTFRFEEGSTVISILPAISTTGLKIDDIDELMDKTYKAMSEEYEVLNKKA